MPTKSNYSFRTTERLTTSWWTVNIWNVIETGVSASFTNESVLFTDELWNEIERTICSTTWWVLTLNYRWLDNSDTITEVTANKKEWWAGTLCFITQFAFDLPDRNKDWVQDDWTKIKFWTNAYITTDNNWTDLKFKDDNNTETTLSELTAGAWTDTKVRVSNNDTTSRFLAQKMVAWNWLTDSTVNPAWDEQYKFDIDLTDTTIFKSTTAWAGDSWKVWRLNANWLYVQFLNNNSDWSADEDDKWLVERATDAEATTWSDTERFITPKQAKDNYWTYNYISSWNWTWTSFSVAIPTWANIALINWTIYDVSWSFAMKWDITITKTWKTTWYIWWTINWDNSRSMSATRNWANIDISSTRSSDTATIYFYKYL
jgi:hypothetical protein